MPTRQTSNVMDLKLFPDTTILLAAYCFEGFLNQSNINKMISNHLIRCKAYGTFTISSRTYQINH